MRTHNFQKGDIVRVPELLSNGRGVQYTVIAVQDTKVCVAQHGTKNDWWVNADQVTFIRRPTIGVPPIMVPPFLIPKVPPGQTWKPPATTS